VNEEPGQSPGRTRIETAGPADERDLGGDFAHRDSIDVRFGDTDAMGHVNNAIFLTYIEGARIAWWAAATGEPIIREPGRSEGLILAEVELAFRAPIFFGDKIGVETRATRIGRASISVEHRMTAGRSETARRLVAVCRSVIVRYDYSSERPVPVPPEIVARLEAFEGRPLRS
jgi:acyl-CoA thioester hydrolase